MSTRCAPGRYCRQAQTLGDLNVRALDDWRKTAPNNGDDGDARLWQIAEDALSDFRSHVKRCQAVTR